MKNKIPIIVAAGLLALSAWAASNLQTFSGVGNNTLPDTVIIPAIPTAQTSIVSVWYTGDTNNQTINFSTGAGAYYQTVTNAATSSITNFVNSTNGLVANSVMVLQHAGVCYTNTLASYGNNSATNGVTGVVTNACFLVLGTGGWGVASAVLDDVYQMSAETSLYVGAGTNALNGVAVFVGNQGRPVMVRMSPALVTNRLSSVTAKFD